MATNLIFDNQTLLPVSIARAWIRGNRALRILITLGAVLVLGAIIIFFIGDNVGLGSQAALAAGITGFVILQAVIGYDQALQTTEARKELEEAEEKVRENPNEARAAWDLARIKLESYLNRNLNQIKWIFFLSLLVMIVGFGIISYGIVRVYQSPTFLSPSILVTISGIVLEFIGASFLIIYKSTMEQARNYVTVLERINAVGMSVQILDSIESADVELRNKARAELSKELLSLYGSLK